MRRKLLKTSFIDAYQVRIKNPMRSVKPHEESLVA